MLDLTNTVVRKQLYQFYRQLLLQPEDPKAKPEKPKIQPDSCDIQWRRIQSAQRLSHPRG